MPVTQSDQEDVRSFYGTLQAVRLLTESPITLSGLQTIQGVSLSAGERVAVGGQTDPLDNGIYLVAAGTWTRTWDCELDDEVGGMFVLIELGTHANEMWRISGLSGATFVGTGIINFESFQRGVSSGFFTPATFVWNVNGTLQAGNKLDGIRSPAADGEIVGVVVAVEERGSDGDTIVDINLHQIPSSPLPLGGSAYGVAGTTIYTTQANRPKLTGDSANKTDNGVHRAFQPDVFVFSGGDFFTVDIDQATNSSRDLTVLMFVRYD